MKEIHLTQGKVAMVDDENFEHLNQYKWCAAHDGYNWYAKRTLLRTKGKMVYMHREIMNAPVGLQTLGNMQEIIV